MTGEIDVRGRANVRTPVTPAPCLLYTGLVIACLPPYLYDPELERRPMLLLLLGNASYPLLSHSNLRSAVRYLDLRIMDVFQSDD